MRIPFKKLVPEAKAPKRATKKANAYDLHSAEKDAVHIHPGEMGKVRTGLALQLPDNICGEIVPRSGLAFKFLLTVVNSPGTIDSDYRGEVVIGLINHGKETVIIQPGDRAAQIKLVRTEEGDFEEVEELEDTERGEGGFGSTGLQDVIKKVRGGEAPIPTQGFA